MRWSAPLVAPRLVTARLVLEPLRVAHAVAMVGVLADPMLYRFIGGEPPGIQQLTARYERQVIGLSPDGSERWLNWIVADGAGVALGFVQATVTSAPSTTAEIAWLVATSQQGRGIATEATTAMTAWLTDVAGVTAFVAHVHPDHKASQAVARHLGLHPTSLLVDGERQWSS